MIVLEVLGILLFDTTSWYGIALAVLLIAGYWGMFKKSGIDSRWSLVPCVRDYMFSKCAGREPEGRVLFIINILSLLMDLTLTVVKVEFEDGSLSNLALAISALLFVLFIIKAVYHIRICSGIIQMYHAKGWWMWLWLLITGLPAVIWGFNPKYQPEIKAEDLQRMSLDTISGVSGDERRPDHQSGRTYRKGIFPEEISPSRYPYVYQARAHGPSAGRFRRGQNHIPERC